MTRRQVLIVTTLLIGAIPALAADFDYRFVHIFSTNSDAYVVATTNIQKRAEGGNIRYYHPINNSQDASITYRFDFCTPVTNAYLYANLYAVKFNASQYGRGSLWGSTNGSDWQLILDMPTPSFDGRAIHTNNLPSTLTGSRSIWLQARLYTVGWNITAQWLRWLDVPNIFVFTADLQKPTVGFKKAILAHFDTLEIGQEYTVESSSDMTNWTFMSSFIATNSSMNHTQFWVLGESTNVSTFYRLNTCTPPSTPEAW